MIRQKTVLLVHQTKVQHYRVGVYNHLSSCISEKGWHLVVLSEDIDAHCPTAVEFDLHLLPLRLNRLRRKISEIGPDAVILFANLRQLYLFPIILFLKVLRIPVIYWGHAIDLEDKDAPLKRLAYAAEHALVDALILYGEDLRQYVATRHQHKIFVANNTLNTAVLHRRNPNRIRVLSKLGVKTSKNILCVGRLQRRKRINELLLAFSLINDPEVGLILVGPDTDNIMMRVCNDRVVWVGELYGEELYDLMESSDVYCIPGHVGLSIVDAFFFGLPVVTTEVDHAPEIMYLKNGINGVILPSGDIQGLACALVKLIRDDSLRATMALAAQQTIKEEASIEKMCVGFIEALQFIDVHFGSR